MKCNELLTNGSKNMDYFACKGCDIWILDRVNDMFIDKIGMEQII